MTDYGLKSLNLPKLYGNILKIFAGIVGSPITQPLLIGSLLENGGIPKLRKLKFSEEPTNFPLQIPRDHAADHLDMPQEVPVIERTCHDQMPFTLIRDYAQA